MKELLRDLSKDYKNKKSLLNGEDIYYQLSNQKWQDYQLFFNLQYSMNTLFLRSKYKDFGASSYINFSTFILSDVANLS